MTVYHASSMTVFSRQCSKPRNDSVLFALAITVFQASWDAPLLHLYFNLQNFPGIDVENFLIVGAYRT